MYQATTPTTWDGFASPQSRKGAWGDYFRGISIVAWLFLLIVNFWWLHDWRDLYILRESSFSKQLQYAAFTIPLVVHLTLGINAIFSKSLELLATRKGKLLFGFCTLMLATAPLSLLPARSASYAAATLGAIFLCYWAWSIDYDRFRRVLIVASLIFFAFLFVLIFRHGFSRTSVGGILRNNYGQAAITSVICMFFAKGKLKWLGFSMGVALVLLVNSRGSMVALSLFAVTYIILRYGSSRGIAFAVVGLVLGISVLAIPKIGKRASETLINDVLRLHEKDRGLGSGMSGRTERWKKGLKAFSKRPAVGYGFRTRTNNPMIPESESAHNGYINLLLDAGIVGASLMLLVFIFEFFKRMKMIRRIKSMYGREPLSKVNDDTLDLNCIVCAFMIAEAALWFIEPLYLNLGASLSVLFFLLLMAPYVVGKTILNTPTAYAYQYPASIPVAAMCS